MKRSLDDLFARWRASYGADAAGFVVDGIIAESDEAWQAASPRILFLLKEPHDRNQVMEACGHDLCALYREPERFNQHRKTVENVMGRWACELRTLYNAPCCTPRAALQSSAVMNLKKIAGGATCNRRDLEAFVRRDAAFIASQLELLAPKIVVCGGTLAFVLPLLGVCPASRDGIVYCRDETIWVDHCHPAYWAGRQQKQKSVLAALHRHLNVTS